MHWQTEGEVERGWQVYHCLSMIFSADFNRDIKSRCGQPDIVGEKKKNIQDLCVNMCVFQSISVAWSLLILHWRESI